MEITSADRSSKSRSGEASGTLPAITPPPAGLRPRYGSWTRRVAGKYGGKRGFLRHHQALLLYGLGVYRRYTQIDWRRVCRLVFVCNGNICRSPYCEALARSLGLAAVSCGLLAEENNSANAAVAALARSRGVELAQHRSKTLQQVDLSAHDLLIAMEPWQARQLRQLTAASASQITLLGLWTAPPRPCLQDPYGLAEEYVSLCLSILDDGVRRIATEVRRCHAG